MIWHCTRRLLRRTHAAARVHHASQPSKNDVTFRDRAKFLITPTRKSLVTTRTTRKIVTFRRPFSLSAVDEVLPSGTYTVDTDEELIDGLSFLAYRRIATLLHLPCTSNRGVSEVIAIDPLELEAAQKRDEQEPI
jgi:hypothetical protein